MSYSIQVLKKSAFHDELVNILERESCRLQLGNLAHGIVVDYFKRRIREIDEVTK